MQDYARTAAWALDFTRACCERNWVCRQIMRIAMGKYAYSEFVHMIRELKHIGWMPAFSYELEDQEYHRAFMSSDFRQEAIDSPSMVAAMREDVGL